MGDKTIASSDRKQLKTAASMPILSSGLRQKSDDDDDGQTTRRQRLPSVKTVCSFRQDEGQSDESCEPDRATDGQR